MTDVVSKLKRRQAELGITVAQLARLANVSRATVSRVLNGDVENCSVATLNAITNVLGIELGVTRTISSQTIMRRKARRKAESLALMVKGNCALENQQVGQSTFASTVDSFTRKLLAGPRKRIWA